MSRKVTKLPQQHKMKKSLQQDASHLGVGSFSAACSALVYIFTECGIEKDGTPAARHLWKQVACTWKEPEEQGQESGRLLVSAPSKEKILFPLLLMQNSLLFLLTVKILSMLLLICFCCLTGIWWQFRKCSQLSHGLVWIFWWCFACLSCMKQGRPGEHQTHWSPMASLHCAQEPCDLSQSCICKVFDVSSSDSQWRL